jgi:hypothetical protein
MMELKGNYNLPKKGSVFQVKDNFENINFGSETIDKIEFKSVILTMGGWFIVNTDYKPQRKIKKLLQQIKNTINLNMNKHYFNGMIIDVDSLPHTFEEQATGYVTFEYTLFVNKGIKYNKREMTMVMNELIKVIHNDYFKEPADFDVYKNRDEFRQRL